MTVPTATPFASSILLLACYELGHQPLSLAWPLAYLADTGVDAVAQALHHCSIRSAFGAVLNQQPLMRNVLADLVRIFVSMVSMRG